MLSRFERFALSIWFAAYICSFITLVAIGLNETYISLVKGTP